MSFSASTGLVYIPAMEIGFYYVPDPHFKRQALGDNLGIDIGAAMLSDDPVKKQAAKTAVKGYLLAWDPQKQKEAWRVPNSGPWNGGVLTTSGNLVVQGDGDGYLNIYRADSGAKIWSFDAQSGIIASPVTYTVSGRQFITVVAGWGGSLPMYTGEVASWGASRPRHNKSRVLTFALNGQAALPPIAAQSDNVPSLLPAQFADAATIGIGEKTYNKVCVLCHGASVVSGGVTPDLRHSTALSNKEIWMAIVADGKLSSQGMVGFRPNFSLEEIDAVRAYVVSRAQLEVTKKRVAEHAQ
jgi:alcohol dehydrogenase (cytochrome c)/quinohemoprotein ethanol dehydrogenase